MLRQDLIRLANQKPELRRHILPLLRGEKVAMEFKTKEELAKYLKDHPNADKSKHTIKEKKEDGGKKDEGKKDEGGKTPEKGVSGVGPKLKPEEAEKKLEKLKVDPDIKQKLKDEYKLDIIGDDLEQAANIAQKLKDGIDKSADVCKLSPPVCKGNLGLTRDKMPQIPGDMSVKEMLNATNKDGTPDEATRAKGKAAVEAGADPDSDKSVLQTMLDTFKSRGVKIEPSKVPVGQLKATQSEIKAGKTFGMADAYLKGKFPNIGDQIVISKDNHILDGHHRWAALLTVDPKRTMNVIRVDMNMQDMLDEADSMAGVYREDFQGKPLPMSDDIKKKKEKAKSGKKASFTVRR